MTPEELRKSGIDIVGDVPWGVHFCQFYETRKDLADILVPYFKAGLENNEFCMWVTADPLNVADARRAMRRAMPDFQMYVKKGQIEILPYSEWYLKDGIFDSARVLNGWVDKLNAALARGFAGLRLTGNTFWLEPANWDSFTDYEAAVDGVIGSYRMVAICTYSLEKCGAFELLDVISNHRFALIKRAGRWQTIESTRDRELRQALLKSEERYHSLFNGMNEGVALHQIVLDAKGEPIDYRFLEVNPAFEKLTGLAASAVTGKTVKEVLPGIEESWINQYGKVALTGEPVVFENYNASLDRWYEVYAYSPEKRYFITLFIDVTVRKKTQEATESMASFPTENPNPVMRIGRDGTILYANHASGTLLRAWKCQPGEPLPSPHDKLVQDAISSAQVQTEEVDFEDRVYLFTFTPVPARGYVNIYGRDVTERRRTEAALRASEKRYRSYIEVTGELGWTTNAGGEVVEDIPSFREFTGQSYEEVKGWGWSKALHPDDLEHTTQVWRNAVSAKSAYEIEYRLRRHDEVYRHFLARGVPVFTEDGPVREWVGICVDITERKEAEEALRRSEELLKQSQEIAHLGSWELDLVNNHLSWSDEVYQLFGLVPREFGATYEAFLEAVHPADRVAVDAAYSGSVKEGRDGYEIEHRIIRKSTGEIRYVYEKCQHIRDASGNIIRSVGMVHDVTERRRIEDALRETRDYLNNLLDYANAPIIVWDLSFRITLFNHAFERLTGLKAGEVIDRQLDILFPADQREESMGHIRRTAAGERWEAVEIPILRMDGEVRIVLWNSATLYEVDGKTAVATIAQGQDITERKRAEEALRDAALRYRTVADNTYNFEFWINPVGQYLYASPSCQRLYGYAPAEFMADGGLGRRVVHPDDLAVFDRHLADVEAKHSHRDIEFRILRADGALRWIAHTCQPVFDEDGRYLGVRGSNRDITERKRAEEELRLTSEELARSNAELEQFAYVASHDLQEPLRMISSYVQLLGSRYSGKLDKDADDFIHYASDGAARMQKLINDLLSYSRVGTRGKAFEAVSLELALSQALDNLKVTVKDSGAVITHDPLPSVHGDVGQLTQVFQNLIDNAIKFRGKASPQIHISVQMKGRECTCSVRDNGIGIDPEYGDRVFVLFQRLHTRREYPGTGIGLAICKRIVERHGGRIWLESKLGEGSTFCFSLPVANRSE